MKAKHVMPCLGYKDAPVAIEWLCKAFGFEKRRVFEAEGIVSHAELVLGDVMIMIGSQDSGSPYSKLTVHPKDVARKETQSPYIVIDDIDRHYAMAQKAGAVIALELKEEDYGGKSYSCYDIEGHLWNFGTYDPWEEN